jgi:hypothetical protein
MVDRVKSYQPQNYTTVIVMNWDKIVRSMKSLCFRVQPFFFRSLCFRQSSVEKQLAAFIPGLKLKAVVVVVLERGNDDNEKRRRGMRMLRKGKEEEEAEDSLKCNISQRVSPLLTCPLPLLLLLRLQYSKRDCKLQPCNLSTRFLKLDFYRGKRLSREESRGLTYAETVGCILDEREGG